MEKKITIDAEDLAQIFRERADDKRSFYHKEVPQIIEEEAQFLEKIADALD